MSGLVHVEIAENSPVALLEVPRHFVTDVTDEANLGITVAPFPGVPGMTVYVFTKEGTGSPVHVEIPEDDGAVAIFEVPLVDTGLADEDNLSVFIDVPGTTLVCYKQAA